MAARWRAKIGDLNAGSSDFLARNSPHEMGLSRGDVADMDIDHSILAIFEDSTAASEGKSSAEEENESLLSALSEMLDDVEDDDSALSPFDTLPDKKLIGHARLKDTAAELSLAHRLRPRPKPPNLMFTVENEAEKDLDCKLEEKVEPQKLKKQSQTFLETRNGRSEGDIEVFSSSSLVSLVRIMHSYCLKLHVEEEERPGKNPTIFSQEEVWKYERPSEENDEEINVVSDDEAPVKDAKEEDELDGKRHKVLKSVLLNGSSSRAAACREKKRVSFGPVQVASFDDAMENGVRESDVNGVKALDELAATSPSSEEAEPPKRETKGKSLSLQQYRQLRQKRLPLVEKQGNYTTKWPSVSVPPKELTPILGLQGQTQCVSRSKTTHPNLHKPKQTMAPSPVRSPPKPDASARHPRRALQLLRSESRADSPLSPVPSKRSPAKRSAPLSTDPPNPVLLPLPVPQTGSPSAAAPPQPNTPASPSKSNQKSSQTPLVDLDLPPSPESPSECPSAPPDCGQPPPPSESSVDGTPDVSQSDCPADEPPSSGTGCSTEPAATDSGIEAPDLTSLLEQFEETQAKEKRVFDDEPKPIDAASGSILPADVDLNQTRSAGPEKTSTPPLQHLSTSDIQETQKPLRKQPEDVDVPEPLSTEIILSSRQSPRRRNPPSKAIQIIDPRPLPARKTHTNSSESPAAAAPPHTFLYLLSEHDYCGSAEDSAARRSKENVEQPPAVRDAHAAPEGAEQIPTGRTKPQLHSEPSAAEPLRLPHCVPTPDEASQPAPCTLPTPPPSPPIRGRRKRRYRRRSPRSDSSSSSRSSSPSSSSSSGSRSPKRRRLRHHHSESSSCSSSPSYSHSPPRRCRFSYSRSRSRSRSRSWSQSQSRSPSRSPSPYMCRSRWREVCSRESRKLRREHEIRMQKLKAIDERRVVYVGRIRRTMTHEELRERFAQFGDVECVSLHFRDRGDHYGFVTFYNMEDAFAAIDNGGKLRRPDELPFDICFGGRRQFCNSHYSDLDANKDAEPSKNRLEDLDFDSLLKQAQRGLKR
ncbi:peroxisome proliferator-activated receptor gamma coactivator-related protein 1 isoform X2 [Salarias fasciatus]|uniref:peroxisome proliferator-activated receptor gamma coactivator-related protein 1 isoform X2 n=1 Tax=Salarias fasciatus TaxID=181472 RepID=UPI001176553A|nr:peroxisome proliferator-activated receptor gamma coactivator-related protein 1-like isoform X2 [Salarias fasciatus]